MAKKKPAPGPRDRLQNAKPDEAAFLRPLVANPKDNTTRLVFADWLDERDDPRAAVLRDDELWSRMTPEMVAWLQDKPRELITRLLAILGGDESYEMWKIVTDFLRKLGTPAIPAIWAWARANENISFRVDAILRDVPPPNLRSIPELVALLNAEDANEARRAAIDLRFHGADAGAAVPALLDTVRAGRRPEFDGRGEDPVMEMVFETLGRIGAPALVAVPEMARCVWWSDAAYQAVLALRPDPDLVYKHINCDDDGDTRTGVRLVRELDPTKTGALIRALRANDGRGSQAAAVILGELGAEAADAVPAMIELFKRAKRDWNGDYTRCVLAQAFIQIGEPARAAVPVLRAVLAEYASADKKDGYATTARDAITSALTVLDPTARDAKGAPKPAKKRAKRKNA